MTITEPITGAELVEKARALIPTLAERRLKTTEARRMLPETVEELREAGSFKVLQSERNGGYGLGLREHADVVSTLAEGCASTSWVVGVVHAHSWVLSHFSQEAQDEVYGVNPNAVISAVPGPRGTAKKVAGGYILNGVYPFCSGSQSSDWLFFGAKLVDDNDEVIAPMGHYLLSTAEASIRDDWYVTGLQGTGSCTVDIKDLFIPEHRYLPGIGPDSAGAQIQTGWNHLLNSAAVLAYALAPSALGLGRRILAETVKQLDGKVNMYGTGKTLDNAVTHLRLAEANQLVDAAAFHLYRAADSADEAARTGREFTDADRIRLRADTGSCVDNCLQAGESLRKLLGGTGLGAGNPVQIAVNDLRALSVHAGLIRDPGYEDYGRNLAGLPSLRAFR